MKAKKKPLETLELDDLDLDEDEVMAKTKTIDIFLPAQKQAGRTNRRKFERTSDDPCFIIKNRS